MARSLHLLSSVLTRTSALCPLSTFASSSCRLISKGPNIHPWARPSQRAPRYRDEMSDGEHELEDVEDKIQDVINKEVQRRKTVRHQILKRKMTPRGPPERKLTWDAMEEIRHLKHDEPEEWTVKRLAEGFSVSEDIILRVLRSKFVPNPERKAKQDAVVMVKLKQPMLPSRPRVELDKRRLNSGSTPALALSSESFSSALIPMSHQSLQPETEQNPSALSVVRKQQFSEVTKYSTDKTQEEMQLSEECTIDEEEEDDEGWDGQVLSEEDIEELMTVKALPVVKKGTEIFDVDGNFLYRI